MGAHKTLLSCNVVPDGSLHASATITVPQSYIHSLYKQTLFFQKKSIRTEGFAHGATPLAYLERAFKSTLVEHLTEFFFHHCVQGELYQALAREHIVVAGKPLLREAHIDPQGDGVFVFDVLRVEPPCQHDWKRLHFKSPVRKKYKDLDRQVETFIKNERECECQVDENFPTHGGDWVQLSIAVADDAHYLPLLGKYRQQVWLRLSAEDTDIEHHQLFLGRTRGEQFVAQSPLLQEFMSSSLPAPYYFHITVQDLVSAHYFSLERFKRHFRVKTVREVHNKLIEVFSFRNDISLRRETVTAVFDLLFKNFPFDIPQHLIDEQIQEVLSAITRNPDYYVYRGQKDFDEKVCMLAERQLKEAIIIDHIAHQERLTVTHDDIISYLNFLQRPRMKDFIYFDIPLTQLHSQEHPLPYQVIEQACLREKTLNHIIYHLTK